MDEVIGTVDFADRRDFASVGLLGKYDKDVYFTQHTFIHESALRLQNIKREVIDISIDQGKSQIVHGKNIEADYIVGWFLEMSNKYYIKKSLWICTVQNIEARFRRSRFYCGNCSKRICYTWYVKRSG